MHELCLPWESTLLLVVVPDCGFWFLKRAQLNFWSLNVFFINQTCVFGWDTTFIISIQQSHTKANARCQSGVGFYAQAGFTGFNARTVSPAEIHFCPRPCPPCKITTLRTLPASLCALSLAACGGGSNNHGEPLDPGHPASAATTRIWMPETTALTLKGRRRASFRSPSTWAVSPVTATIEQLAASEANVLKLHARATPSLATCTSPRAKARPTRCS